jgi:hypothetical protein
MGCVLVGYRLASGRSDIPGPMRSCMKNGEGWQAGPSGPDGLAVQLSFRVGGGGSCRELRAAYIHVGRTRTEMYSRGPRDKPCIRALRPYCGQRYSIDLGLFR